MWKDFFYFSNTQRLGIAILLALIVIGLVATLRPPFLNKSKIIEDDTEFLREAEEFKANLKEKEQNRDSKEDFYPFEYPKYAREQKVKDNYRLFDFDPNIADSSDFVALGLKPYIARNILRYRAKGGLFKTPEAFSKIYGLSEDKYLELQPYIRITENQKEKEQDIPADTIHKDLRDTTVFVTEKEQVIVELNGADTLLLKEVKGIGNVLAKRIIVYRRILGGYNSVDQLKEVYGMTPENFERVSEYVIVDISLISPIDVNKASIERLKAHPYIKTFQRAKSIYEYRRKKITLENLSQLKHLEEFTEHDWERLAPYLIFE